jgi:hypothetical protein
MIGETTMVVIILDKPAFMKLNPPLITYSESVLGFSYIHFLGTLFLNSLSILCNPVKKIVQLTPFLRIDSPHPLKNPNSPYSPYIFLVSFQSLDIPITPLVFLKDDILDVLSTSNGCVMTDVISPIWKFFKTSV